jgi:hypothetical protein
MTLTAIIRTSAVAAASLVLAGCSWARVDEEGTSPSPLVPRSFMALMNTAQAVPPTNGGGTGAVYATLYPDGSLHWDAAYHGLTGPATAAHLRGPAGVGVNAGAVVNIGALGVAPRMRGAAHLTDAQIADLMGGLWYADIQTRTNPNGEIRGQIIFMP